MDGTMCEGTGCPMRESCYRYNAELFYGGSTKVVRLDTTR